MENINVINLFHCIFVFEIVCHFTFSSGITWTQFSYDNVYTGRTCAQEDTLFQKDNIYQPVSCGKLCYLDAKCIYASYQLDTQQCIGCGYRPYVTLQTSQSDELQSSMHFGNKDIKFDCTDILKTNSSAASGVYEVATPMKVYCDMTTDGGGWTVIQNRYDGSVDFDRNFSEYENGFGDINGEFSLGLKNIQKIAETPTELRFDLTGYDGKRFGKYTDFQLLRGTNYMIDAVRSETSGIGRIFGSISEPPFVPFSTFDRDMDQEDYINCAKDYGAFWYSLCSGSYPVVSNLNGLYCTPERKCDNHSDGWPGHFHAVRWGPLKASRMMIRRVNHTEF